MSSSSLTRGAVKDVRTLVKDVRQQGFRVQHDGGQLLIFARDAADPCGAIPLKVHDHRALKNVRADLRRSGILPRPHKRERRRPVPASSSAVQAVAVQPLVEPPPPAHDDYDWLRRPYDRDRTRILRDRLRAFLDGAGGSTGRNRRMFASAALAYARREGLRSFSSEQPEIAAQAAVRFLLLREGALSIWTLRLFHETLDEAEQRLRRIKQQAA